MPGRHICLYCRTCKEHSAHRYQRTRAKRKPTARNDRFASSASFEPSPSHVGFAPDSRTCCCSAANGRNGADCVAKVANWSLWNWNLK